MTLPDPLHRCQFDGSPFASANCTAASAAMALDAYTHGTIRVTPDQIRRAQSDQAGGISCTDAAEAWRRFGADLTVRSDFDAALDRLRAGNGVMVQGDYGSVPDRYAVQDSFDGGHCVYAVRIEDRPSGEDVARIHDPLSPTGAIYWPVSILTRYFDDLPGAELAWGRGEWSPPVAPTHRALGRRSLVNAPGGDAAIVQRVRDGAYARVARVVSGRPYTLGGKRSTAWVEIVALGSGTNAHRLARPLYSGALGWVRKEDYRP